MAVEILTVSLSDESLEALAKRVAQILGGHITLVSGESVTQSNPPSAQNPQGAEPPASAPQADPWTNPAPQQQFTPPPAPTTSQAVSVAPQQPQQAVQTPTCAHGPMRYVPAGFSQSTGRAYGAFWGCPAPRGAPDKCKSVTA